MNFTASAISYKQTKAFSKLAIDYIEGADALEPFFTFAPNLDGIKNAISQRKKFTVNRQVLVTQLQKQYNAKKQGLKTTANIELLLNENTFTVTTAHQPNIFTGHLYFVYKIIHAIKLADDLKKQFPKNNFVPVFFMGSEDADLEELGTINVHGKIYKWDTAQKGAVGRMQVDEEFIALINELDAQLGVEEHGEEILNKVRQAYAKGKNIEQSTFDLVHDLFADYGLVVFLPDNPVFKKELTPVIKKELSEQFSQKAMQQALVALSGLYKMQVAGRQVNLFYLLDGLRERLERKGDGFIVHGTDLRFTQQEILQELKNHPERFSPNVILRPVFQEMLLPNIIFIGGGAEIAYWLELKNVFAEAGVFFPVLMLRNSFTVIPKKIAEKIQSLGLNEASLFETGNKLKDYYVKKETKYQLSLSDEKLALIKIYHNIRESATKVNPTFSRHVWALQQKSKQKLDELEKKMLRSEKLKFDAGLRQISKIKDRLFPGDKLQERVDNLLPYYALYGKGFLDVLYTHSGAWQQQYCILTETE
ncbi:MAG: bacillithiol biosynthesis cysteine-adding enzyme BshC [Chitinophagaceae bacterium]|jgi:bacillithiol biosynthesis cysteine-adding enzyme BshC|nr:bacillithiol biosynthesis cysteine-adding enzyme BshC [Chitinophagaceae bacterium]MBP6046747.1 bacillithiol biosynthesis cysteine-adding enzyme BshC [Ferruginibacter sp.]MBK8929206.1 bacillithiol biosynthesis cysteine-adding enzyme BshC [Chitinophagaceae bacterium]MBK9957542.1 bacillithiol biosynthesis cysteine-adding enzyme BshC [Chitinophagaceae bacterium]MBL0254914.1 bacillithiol biosynthesis cysteine-adding enzyme BshC [Chitinophagaceae bacterium]